MISNYIPVIVVITKLREDSNLQTVINSYFSNKIKVIRIQAKKIEYDDGQERKPENLEELVELTYETLKSPEIQVAFIASQKVNLDLKKKLSKTIIKKIMSKNTFFSFIIENGVISLIIIEIIKYISGLYITLDIVFLNNILKK